MTGRALVDALAAVAPRYSRRERAEKLRLLARLATARLGQPAALLRLHETLCFLRAYPDDAGVAAGAERGLRAFGARVARLSPAARERLRDTGIAATSLDYPFDFPMARWLASRFPRDTGVRWPAFEHGDRLEEMLPLLVTHAEGEAFTEGGLGWRRWLALARGSRPLSDLAVLLELFERSELPPAVRDALFEDLGLPVEWHLRGDAPSRTLVHVDSSPRAFHRHGLRRSGVDVAREIGRPLPPLRRARPAQAAALLEAARAAMATRARTLYAFSHPNLDDVLIADPGRGLRIALLGLDPAFRLPLEAYYAFFVLKNGVPIGYGGAWGMFGAIEFAINVFESFRQGESAWVISQVLRAYRQVFRPHTVRVDRTQVGFGPGNEEALASGAFYFYRRLGFRPLDPAVARLADEEQARIAGDRAYRSPLGVLRRLARSDLALALAPDPTAGVRLTDNALGGLVTRRVARVHGGDRTRAARRDAAQVAAALGARRWRSWPPAERRAFARLAPVLALLPDLPRWPAADRARLLRVIRAKGGPSERAYRRLLDGHRRLRRSLVALLRSGPAP